MQAWIPVVSSSLYFWKSVFSFRVDSILKWRVYIKLKVSWLRAFLWCMSQTSRDRDNSRRVRTHEKNSGETVRRLGTIIQSIFCAQSGAGIRLNFWKWSGESRYPGALPPLLENFRRAFSPDPTDCPWVSEDARYAARWAEYLCISVQGPLASFHLVFHGKVEDVFLDVYLQNSNHHRHLHPILARCCHKRT